VLSDLFLGEVARRQPKTAEELERIPGASPQQIRKIAPQVLEAVQAGQSGAPPVRPKPKDPRRSFGRGSMGQSPEVEDRYEKLRAWRKGRAEARKVEVQVIAPNAVLMAVAQSRPRDLEELGRIAGMDDFRVRQYGAEMLAALEAVP
jgi:ribonuclease D